MLLIDREKFKNLPKEIQEYILASCKLSDKVYRSIQEGLINDDYNIEGTLNILNNKYEDMFEWIKKK